MRRALVSTVTPMLLATACSAAVQSSTPAAEAPGTSADATTSSPTVTNVATDPGTTGSAPGSPSTAAPVSTAPSSTAPAASTTTTSTTTTTIPLDVYDPACVVRVAPGDGLLQIVDRFDDDTVDAETVAAENGLDSLILEPGQLLDVCVDNGLDDIDGSARTERNEVLARRDVEVQQTKLNELFAGYGIRELLVDGISGPVTRQRLCAFRLAAGLPVSLADMEAGSEEEQILLAAETLPIPFTSAVLSERWVLIDRTCQIMFVGSEGRTLQFVFPTSTGQAGYRTRDQNRSEVFKYDPASGNGGWHNSRTYPAAEDNPLNGNMYKPLYFDGGQAIHGANNVPRSPASHGCARLRVDHMDQLIDWLGLGDETRVTYSESQIDLTVNVQGSYVGA